MLGSVLESCVAEGADGALSGDETASGRDTGEYAGIGVGELSVVSNSNV